MFGEIFSSIIGGLSQIGTNRMNKSIADSRNNLENSWFNRSMNFEREMFNAENDWNLQQWERQNAYDSPEAQRQRLIKAGINPLMVGDAGVQSSPISGASGGSVGVPNAEMANITNPFEMSMEGLGNILDAKLKELGIDRAEIDNQIQKAKLRELPDYWMSDEEMEQWAKDKAHEEVANMKESTNELKSRASRNYAEKAYLDKYKEKVEAEKKVIDKNLAFLDDVHDFRVREEEAKMQKAIEEVNTQQAETDAVKASANASNAAASLSREQASTERVERDEMKKNGIATRREQNARVAQIKVDSFAKMVGLDLNEKEIDSMLQIFERYPLLDPGKLISCLKLMKSRKSSAEKEAKRRFGAQMVEVVKAIAVAGIGAAAYVLTKSPATAVKAAGSAAAAGAAVDAVQGVPMN